MRRIAPDLRRVERGQIGAIGVIGVLERRPRSVDEKRAEHDEHHHRLNPPLIAPVGLTPPARHEPYWSNLHQCPPQALPRTNKPAYVSTTRGNGEGGGNG